MKRILAILLTVMLLAAVMPAASFAEAVSNYSKTTVYRTTASTLNVRSGPGTKYKRIGSLPRGAAFTVSSSSGNWYKIKALRSGKVGWVSKSYTTRGAYAKVTTKETGLNVRTGPGTGYRLIRSLAKGTRDVLVKYISNGWAYVKKGSLEGWACIRGNYSYNLLTWNA